MKPTKQQISDCIAYWKSKRAYVYENEWKPKIMGILMWKSLAMKLSLGLNSTTKKIKRGCKMDLKLKCYLKATKGVEND